jgi:phospholipase/lecithinase/hemolysin
MCSFQKLVKFGWSCKDSVLVPPQAGGVLNQRLRFGTILTILNVIFISITIL